MKQSTALKSITVGVIMGVSMALLRAATPIETITEFGLVGTWSPDCAVPVGTPGASRVTYEPSENGLATSTSIFSGPIPLPDAQSGPSYREVTSVFHIDAATALSDRQIKLVGQITIVNGQAGPTSDVAPREMTIEKANGQIRVLDNRLAGATAIAVEDGVVRATGKPTPFLKRCETVDASPRSSN